jgi:hypothetical protein
MPNKGLRLEAEVQSFGSLRDFAASIALERSLRLNLAAHLRAAQATSGVTRQFKRGTDGREMGREVNSLVGGGLDTHKQLSLPAPTAALLEWGKGCWSITLNLRGGCDPDDPPARRKADALDTIRSYGQLWTVIHTDGSAEDGVKRGGSSAIVTSGDPCNPNFLGVRHQYRPEYTTSLGVEMLGIWLSVDCLDEVVAAGVLICSDSLWALDALKESWHSTHSVLVPLQARLRGIEGCVCFQ